MSDETQIRVIHLMIGWFESYIMPPILCDELVEALRELIISDEYPEEAAICAQRVYELALKRETERPRTGFVYLLQGGGYCKIGRSVNPTYRLKQISPVLPFPVELTHIVVAFDAVKAEAFFHEMFGRKHSNGEWFRLEDCDIEDLENCFGFRKVTPDTMQAKVEWMRSIMEHNPEPGPEPGGRM